MSPVQTVTAALREVHAGNDAEAQSVLRNLSTPELSTQLVALTRLLGLAASVEAERKVSA